MMQGFKYELKYFINNFDYQALNRKLGTFMKPDPNADENGQYHIRSLYFDDVNSSGLYEKLAGVRNRSKYRIRIYDYSEKVIKLEKKIKKESLSKKEVRQISRAEYDCIIRGDISFLTGKRDELFLDFYQRYRNVLLRPKVIVAYDRNAFVIPEGNLRITFDRQLKTGLHSTDLFKRDLPLVGVNEDGYMILEVKYKSFLPDYVRSAIQLNNRNRFSISKYVICMKYNKFDIWEDN